MVAVESTSFHLEHVIATIVFISARMNTVAIVKVVVAYHYFYYYHSYHDYYELRL